MNSRTARATERDPVLRKTNKQRELKVWFVGDELSLETWNNSSKTIQPRKEETWNLNPKD